MASQSDPNSFNAVDIFITINGQTLSSESLGLLSWTVKDEEEGDNTIELTCRDDDYRIADSGILKIGQIMSVKFGYKQGQFSNPRSGYVILKPETDYHLDGIVSKITAHTKSSTLAVRKSQKNYAGTSIKTILQGICARSGLTLNITGGNEQVAGFSHANWSDRQVIGVLADRFNYQATYDSETVIFAPRDYGANPSLDLVFGVGADSNIVSATLSVDANKHLGDAKTVAVGVDPFAKKVVTATSGPADKALAVSAEDGHTWVTTIGSKVQSIVDKLPGRPAGIVPPGASQSQSVAEVTANTAGLPDDLATFMSSPDHDPNNLKALATGEKQKKQKKKGELQITSVGLPLAKPRMIAHVRGLAKRDSGNWYVISVEHKCSQDEGYMCHFELARHGSNAKGTNKNTEALNKGLPLGGGAVLPKRIAVSAETGAITK